MNPEDESRRKLRLDIPDREKLSSIKDKWITFSNGSKVKVNKVVSHSRGLTTAYIEVAPSMHLRAFLEE